MQNVLYNVEMQFFLHKGRILENYTLLLLLFISSLCKQLNFPYYVTCWAISASAADISVSSLTKLCFS